MEIYLTSDLHLCHQQPFLYEPRGFHSVEEMNETIVERWNSIVKPVDHVLCLGDIMLNDNENGLKYFEQLNGLIFVIWGNHDTDARKNLLAKASNFYGGWYAYQRRYKKYSLYLSHYPTLTANYDDKHFSQHVLNFHGHVHSKEKFLDPSNPFMYNVCLDAHNCYPVHIDEAINDMKEQYLRGSNNEY